MSYGSYEATPAEPPLDHPWYGIGFGAAVKRFFTKYATFDGRASRGEYWWAYLFNAIVALVLYGVVIIGIVSASSAGSADSSAATTPQFGALLYVPSSLLSLFFLGTIVPYLAVAVRRLHDTGRSGWSILFGFIPLVGGIILLVFFVSATTPAAEQYGPPRPQHPPQGYGAPGPYGQAYPPA